jgi:hypothetical protein
MNKCNQSCIFLDVGPVDSDQTQLKNKHKPEQIIDRERISQLQRSPYVRLEVPLVVNRNIGKLIGSHQIQNGSGNVSVSVHIRVSLKFCNGGNDDDHFTAPLESVYFQPDDLRHADVFCLGALSGIYYIPFFIRNRRVDRFSVILRKLIV